MAPHPYENRIRWFHEARFGLFVHWGLYSLMERGEWVMFHERIPAAEYTKLADRFTGERFDADALAELAVDAGMRYGALTTKHHDGFCLWDTATDDYNSVRTAARRDFVGEFVEAFRKRGLKVGLYLSNIDWRYPGYFEPEKHPDSRDRLVQSLHDQTEELLTRYGRIDLLWYDGCWVDHGKKKVDEAAFWRSQELLDRIYELQPHILVNNRLGVPADLDTPEQKVTASESGRGWESCMTIGDPHGWGFVRHSSNRKTLAQLLQNLSIAAAGEGNYLLNIGPRGDGSIPEEDAIRLRQMGEWLAVHGEAIYGSERFTPDGGNHFQGVFTRKGKTGYLHVFRWSSPEIVLPLMATVPTSARLMTTSQPLTIETRSNARVVVGGLPPLPPHPCQSVIKLTFAEAPRFLEEPDHAAWLDGRA